MEIDATTVNQYLCKLPSKYSCSDDGIPTIFLKRLHDTLSLLISTLFLALTQCRLIIYKIWNHATVTPV